MDMDTSRTLTKVLGKRDIDKIPADVLKKLEKYCENNNEQFIQTKVLYNTTQKNIGKKPLIFIYISSRLDNFFFLVHT